ncbi:hypothetical protein B0A55_12412 [Friedmanniomyces simplex]|uniref:Transcription factor domain-containing protein n=1 Tax=Friedmanniomyces simplex TaxID=329884 RepID=A0A4U0WI34_9PEZI|nr:hypothetical protein B0A55_12412 [Friedmanniomyces simplex]
MSISINERLEDGIATGRLLVGQLYYPGKQATHQTDRKKLGVSRVSQAGDPILYRPATDWEEIAICQFLEAFVYPDQSPPVIAFQYLSFLPDLYGKSFDRSCLTEAITAVAFARLANLQQANTDLSLRARKAYASALSLVNRSMSVPEQRKSDEVLATLCLLAKYELIAGDATDRLFQSHERGQAALIGERHHVEWLRSDVGVGLFRLVYIRHLLNCVATGERPSVNLGQNACELAFPEPCVRKLMGLTYRIAALRYNAAQLVCEFDSPNQTDQLAEDAVKLDAAMTELLRELPAGMRYYTIDDHAQGFDRGYSPPLINIFQDLQHASFWHVFFYGLLHVQQTLLQYASYPNTLSIADLRMRLLSNVDDICASVPYALNEDCSSAFITTKGGGAVAAHYLTWLLTAASSIQIVPAAQKEWMAGRLSYIGFAHGIKEALMHA